MKTSHARKWIWIACVAFAAAAPWALKITADNDLWWHARTGLLILEERALPLHDPFSFTATSAAWTNHEWLSDVVLGLVFTHGGGRGLSLLRAALLFTVLGGLAALLWSRFPHPLFVLAATLAVAPLVRIFVSLRPHGATYLFVIVLLLLLERSDRDGRWLWGVPPLVALWANLHGGFLFGLGLLAISLGSRMLGLENEAMPASREARRRMLLVAGLALVAPLCTPYGARLVPYLVRELGADHSLILEWRGIWSFPDFRWPFLLLVAVPLAAAALARRLRPATPLLLLLVAAIGTLRHGRFLILLAFFSALVTASALGALADRLPRRSLLERLRSPAWVAAAGGLALVSGAMQLAVDYRRQGLRLAVDTRRMPVAACEFLRAHDLGPNLLLRLDWGGYAIWHLYPSYRVSGDGRNLTVYDERFVDRLLRAYDTGALAESFRGQDVDAILSENAGPTYEALSRDREWVRVHEDTVAAVWVRPDVARALGARGEAEVQRASLRPFFP